MTITGGEPFDREDLAEICAGVHDRCRPRVVVIPTSGASRFLSSEGIAGRVGEILERCSGSKLVVNLSVDGVGVRHDRLRGCPDAFDRALETFHALRDLGDRRLTLGTNTVISRYNAGEIPEVHRFLTSLRPDSIVFELAESRVELATAGEPLAPEKDEAAAALRFVADALASERPAGLPRLIRALRLAYYEELIRTVRTGRSRLPCTAGFASAHLQPDGELWACPAAGMSMGNVREEGYDFRRVYFGGPAAAVRARIRREPCTCTTATIGYLDLLLSPTDRLRAAWATIPRRG